MPFFSIILPTYNSENTISSVLDSILAQDYEDFEVLIINDGSTDHTEEIVLEYSAKDNRIRFFTIDNKGPSEARNVGIDKANGLYLLFIDSDDLLQPNVLEYLHQQQVQGEFDILIFGYTITDTNFESLAIYGMPDAEYSGHTRMGQVLPELYQSNLLNQVWNKVYSLDWLRDSGVRFSDYRFAEDRLFLISILRYAQSIKVVQKSCYLYVISGDNSLTRSYYDKKFEACLLVDQQICALALEWGNESQYAQEVWDYMFFKTVLSCLTQLYSPTCSLSGKMRRVLAREILNHPKVNRKLLLNRSVGVLVRSVYFIVRSRILWLNSLTARIILLVEKMEISLMIKIKHRKIEG